MNQNRDSVVYKILITLSMLILFILIQNKGNTGNFVSFMMLFFLVTSKQALTKNSSKIKLFITIHLFQNSINSTF